MIKLPTLLIAYLTTTGLISILATTNLHSFDFAKAAEEIRYLNAVEYKSDRSDRWACTGATSESPTVTTASFDDSRTWHHTAPVTPTVTIMGAIQRLRDRVGETEREIAALKQAGFTIHSLQEQVATSQAETAALLAAQAERLARLEADNRILRTDMDTARQRMHSEKSTAITNHRKGRAEIGALWAAVHELRVSAAHAPAPGIAIKLKPKQPARRK